MADMADRDKALAERNKAYMEGDFLPGYTPERTPDPQHRLANAAEFSAFQLGQINQSLKRIASVLEKQFGK